MPAISIKLMPENAPFTDEQYHYLLEHVLAPTMDELMHRTEQLDELAREIPLTEVADLLGPQYSFYLWQMCVQYAHPAYASLQPKNPALALPYAEALVAARPDEDEGHEIRAYCRAQLVPLNYAALLADYDWLARRPLRGADYWTYSLPAAAHEREHYDYLIERYTQEDRYRRTHFWLASAWAYYHLGKLEAANDAFCRAFLAPARKDFSFDPEWPVNLLPPVPDPSYLRWQIDQQLARRSWAQHSAAVQNWLQLAHCEYERLVARH